jgi:hypothetical protein
MAIGDVDSQERGTGARFNDGKVALDLVPLSALEDCARVFDYGRRKYAAWNWAKGMGWSDPYGCLLRHMAAWFNGENNDPESGLPHLGHAMCNLVMLATFARTYHEGDDRPVQWLNADPAKALDMVSMDPPFLAEGIALIDGFPVTGAPTHDLSPAMEAYADAVNAREVALPADVGLNVDVAQ